MQEFHVTEKAHNPVLDWIRFIAAFIVLLTHTRDVIFVEFSKLESASQGLLSMGFYALTRLGTEAVVVFFVLSGFLVGGPAYERAQKGSFNIASYTLDRVVRIIVPLFPAIALTGAVTLALGNDQDVFVKIVGHLLSVQGAYVPVLQNNVPLWSLSYEVWFYVIGGSLGYLICRSNSLAGKMIAVAFLSLASLVFLELKILYLAIWILGAFAYVVRPETASMTSIVGGLCLTVLGVALRQFSAESSFFSVGEEGLWAGEFIAEAVIALGMSIIVANCFKLKPRRGRLAAVGAFLSSFSFSTYLIHQPILRLWPVSDLNEFSASGVMIFCLAILLCLFLAFGYSRAFETTGPAIKRYIRNSSNGRVPS